MRRLRSASAPDAPRLRAPRTQPWYASSYRLRDSPSITGQRISRMHSPRPPSVSRRRASRCPRRSRGYSASDTIRACSRSMLSLPPLLRAVVGTLLLLAVARVAAHSDGLTRNRERAIASRSGDPSGGVPSSGLFEGGGVRTPPRPAAWGGRADVLRRRLATTDRTTRCTADSDMGDGSVASSLTNSSRVSPSSSPSDELDANRVSSCSCALIRLLRLSCSGDEHGGE